MRLNCPTVGRSVFEKLSAAVADLYPQMMCPHSRAAAPVTGILHASELLARRMLDYCAVSPAGGPGHNNTSTF